MNRDQFKCRIKQFEHNASGINDELIVNKTIEVKEKSQESINKIQTTIDMECQHYFVPRHISI